MIKVVIQSIPTYMMSCFELSNSLCNDIESLIAKFFWGGDVEGRKIHWLSWRKLTKNKKQGGMGFRQIKAFNLISPFSKTMVYDFIDDDSFLSKVYKARYYPNNGAIEIEKGHNPTFLWTSIQKLKWIVKTSSFWRIGNRVNVEDCGDQWLPNLPSFMILQHKCNNIDQDLRVSDLIDHNVGCWRTHVIRNMFNLNIVDNIMSNPITHMQMTDFLIWKHTPHGNYYICEIWLFGGKVLK